MPWTAFLDIESDDPDFTFAHVYIEALKQDAINIFKSYFGFQPIGQLCCPKCNLDYSIEEHDNLQRALEENHIFLGEVSVSTYIQRNDVRIITKEDIGDAPRKEKLLPDHFHECDSSGCQVGILQSRVGDLENLLYHICEGIRKNELNLENIYQRSKKTLSRGSL